MNRDKLGDVWYLPAFTQKIEIFTMPSSWVSDGIEDVLIVPRYSCFVFLGVTVDLKVHLGLLTADPDRKQSTIILRAASWQRLRKSCLKLW